MKLLANAIKYTYDGRIRSIEEAFSRFAKLDEDGIREFRGTMDEYALLTAYRALKERGYHYADEQDRKEFQALIGMLKLCQEEKRESLQAPGNHPRNRKVRLHHSQGRPLPAQA